MMSDKMGEKYSREDIQKVFKLSKSRISFRKLAQAGSPSSPQESNDDEEMQDTTRL